MIKIRCVVERITYQNYENGYSVLKVRVKGYNDLVPLVGNLIDVNVGSVLLPAALCGGRNAHRINAGQMPDISNGKNTDFFFIDKEEPEEAMSEVVNLVKNKLPKYYRTPTAQIQVLTPMQRGIVGAANLNRALQEALNPEGEGLHRSGSVFRKYDKVMQIKNNYDKEVFNGDIGIIDSVDLEDRTLKVKFDERIVEYEVTELDELVHAYATTIHKAQGSEYPIVVMPVLMTHYVMLQRNLIYTGITRAKKILVIVGAKKALAYAVRNVTVTKRNTMLKERISGEI